MKNINFKLYRQKVKVLLQDGREIVGMFTDDFEDEQQILVGSTLIDYSEIQRMEAI